MIIEGNKLKKFLEDTGLINQVNNELFINEYFIENKSKYNSYLDGAGPNYSIKYICVVKKEIEYNNEKIIYVLESKTYSSDDGFSPDMYIKGDLISSTPINLNNEYLLIEDVMEDIYGLITSKYGITDELINNYYFGDTNTINYLERIVNLYNQISKKEKLINSLNYSIECINKEIVDMKHEMMNISTEKGKQKTK